MNNTNDNNDQESARLKTLKHRYKYVNLAHNIIAMPLIIILLVFGLPIIGNITSGLFFVSLGCAGNEGSGIDCSFLGKDVGDIAYGYMVGIFLGGFINPILVLQFLTIFIPFQVVIMWVSTAVVLILARYLIRIEVKQLSQ